jgi:hypothetical protein
MCANRTAVAGLAAVAIAVAPALLSASDRADTRSDGAKVVREAPIQEAASARFTALKGVKAAPMASSELKAVKGQHAHFWNPGAPLGGTPHVVNSHSQDNWIDLGHGLVGPGYHGLCKANVVSGAIFINPGGGC